MTGTVVLNTLFHSLFHIEKSASIVNGTHKKLGYFPHIYSRGPQRTSTTSYTYRCLYMKARLTSWLTFTRSSFAFLFFLFLIGFILIFVMLIGYGYVFRIQPPPGIRWRGREKKEEVRIVGGAERVFAFINSVVSWPNWEKYGRQQDEHAQCVIVMESKTDQNGAFCFTLPKCELRFDRGRWRKEEWERE